MDHYLGKILELGIEEGDEVNLSEKQTKEIISQKLVSQNGKKKKKRGKRGDDNNHGMTEEELIAEQQKLFESARNYNYDDVNYQDSGTDYAMQNPMNQPV